MSALLESIFGRNIAPRRIAIIGVGVVVTALVILVSQWVGEPVQIPLFAGLPLESVGAMTTKLTELAIPYTLDESGTTIYVNREDQARARVELAKEGMPNAGRPGMEIFDKPTWGMTDFTQKVNLGRAYEGQLERTIGNMRDVDKVQVHLALEDEALFKQNERPSKASVTLTMKGGGVPPEAVVRGIASLVAGSIGGLDPQHVTVIDERGHALASDDDGSAAGLTSRHLSVQREVEVSLQKKAESLLASLVGPGNSTVQVTASINFDKTERTTQRVDPDNQAASTEQKAEVLPGTPEQGAGYSTTSTSFENSRSVENFVGSTGNVTRLTVAVLIADKVTMTPADSARKTLATRVVTPRDSAEVAQIERLMRSGLGVDSARGDLISVVSAPFDMPLAEAVRDTLPTPSLMTRMQTNPKPFIAIAALIVLLIIAVVMLLVLKPAKAPVPVAVAQIPAAPAFAELPAGSGSADDAAAADGNHSLAAPPRQVILPSIAVSLEREQAMATVDQRPEAAVRVTRNWLRE